MVKFTGEYVRRSINEDGNIEMTFVIKDYNSKKRAEQLSKGEYNLEATKPKSKRSLQQNAMLWAIIRDIAQSLMQDEMDVYVSLLEDTGAKYEYIMGIEEIEDELKKNFRAVKPVRPEEHNGKKFIVYKVFYGSSKFNTEEMGMLLDRAMLWAYELDIPVERDGYY